MPILVFFHSTDGSLERGLDVAQLLRYSILVIFIIAAINITPTTDIMNMCIFAAPMIVLYLASIGVAWFVHPTQRKKRGIRAAASSFCIMLLRKLAFVGLVSSASQGSVLIACKCIIYEGT